MDYKKFKNLVLTKFDKKKKIRKAHLTVSTPRVGKEDRDKYLDKMVSDKYLLKDTVYSIRGNEVLVYSILKKGEQELDKIKKELKEIYKPLEKTKKK